MFLTGDESKKEEKQVDLTIRTARNGYVVVSEVDSNEVTHIFTTRKGVQSHIAAIVDGFCDLHGDD